MHVCFNVTVVSIPLGSYCNLCCLGSVWPQIAVEQGESIYISMAVMMRCWWEPNVHCPLDLINTHIKEHMHFGFEDTELLRERVTKDLDPPYPTRFPALPVYLFMYYTTSGKFIPPPEQCHSIFGAVRHQSAAWQEMAKTTSWRQSTTACGSVSGLPLMFCF